AMFDARARVQRNEIEAALPFDNRAQRTRIDIAERDRAVIALQHDRIFSRFGDVHGRARGAIHLHIVLHGKAVEEHAHELRIFRLLSRAIKARSTEPDVVRLPLARAPAGITAGGAATDTLIVDPAMVNAAAIGRSHSLRGAVAVEDLDFIEPVEVDTGVRAFGK